MSHNHVKLPEGKYPILNHDCQYVTGVSQIFEQSCRHAETHLFWHDARHWFQGISPQIYHICTYLDLDHPRPSWYPQQEHKS